MAIRTYRQWALDTVPTWLRGNWGGALVELIGFVFDSLQEAAFEAGASQSLYAPTMPDDALQYVGSERAMQRYDGESVASYKARLQGAWTAWSQAGTTTGLLAQLSAAGFTATIKQMRDWNWDGDTANWSRFWVVVTGHGWSRTHWGDGGKWGQTVWGVNATRNQARTLRSIVRQWKPAHMTPIIVIVMDDVAWAAGQPDGTWGVPANRNPAALYHYER